MLHWIEVLSWSSSKPVRAGADHKFFPRGKNFPGRGCLAAGSVPLFQSLLPTHIWCDKRIMTIRKAKVQWKDIGKGRLWPPCLVFTHDTKRIKSVGLGVTLRWSRSQQSPRPRWLHQLSTGTQPVCASVFSDYRAGIIIVLTLETCCEEQMDSCKGTMLGMQPTCRTAGGWHLTLPPKPPKEAAFLEFSKSFTEFQCTSSQLTAVSESLRVAAKIRNCRAKSRNWEEIPEEVPLFTYQNGKFRSK